MTKEDAIKYLKYDGCIDCTRSPSSAYMCGCEDCSYKEAVMYAIGILEGAITGEWTKEKLFRKKNYSNPRYQCSACLRWSDFDYSYCPHCGIKMGGKDVQR